MKILTVLLTLFILLQAEKRSDVNNQELRMDSALAIMRSDPSRALQLCYINLEHIETSHDSTIAGTKMIIGKILNEQGLPAQALEYYISSLEIYSKIAGFSDKVGWHLLDIGNIYFHQGLLDRAAEKYQIALNKFQHIGLLYAQATALNNLGLVASERGDFTQAVLYYQEALNLRIQYNKEPYLILHSYKYLGDLYERMEQHDKAMQFYEKIVNMKISAGEGNILGLSQQSIGDIYQKKGDLHLALKYYHSAEQDYLNTYNPKYLSTVYSNIAALFSDVNTDSSMVYLKKSLDVAQKHHLIGLGVATLEKMIQLTEHSDNLAEVIEYYNKLNNLKELRYETELQQLLHRAEIQLELSNYKQNLFEKENRLQTARNQRVFLIVIVILLIALFWMLYRRYENNKSLAKHREELLQQKLDIEHLKAERRKKKIEVKKNELLIKATYLQQKNDLLKMYAKDLKYSISLLKNKQDRKPFHSLVISLEELMKTEDQWPEFENQFVESYPDFLLLLAKQHPNLTGVDLKMCAYLKMNMNTKDISKLTGLSIRAIEVRRSRLRKKINIAKGENLYSYFAVHYNVDTDV